MIRYSLEGNGFESWFSHLHIATRNSVNTAVCSIRVSFFSNQKGQGIEGRRTGSAFSMLYP